MASFLGQDFAPVERLNWRRLMKTLGSGADLSPADINYVIDHAMRPEDVERFDALCDEHLPDLDVIAAFVGAMVEEVAQRPTPRSGDSSLGPQSTEPNSTSASLDRAAELMAGRPDLQVLLLRQQESA